MARQASDRINKGYLNIFSVIVVGAAALAAVGSLSLLSMGSIRASTLLSESYQAKSLADACAETALQQIKDSTSFSGSDNFSLGSGTCSYTVTNTGGQNREINAQGLVEDVIRKVKIEISAVNPQINVASWQEIS